MHQPPLLEVGHTSGDLRAPVEQRLAADLVLIVPDVVQEASALSLVNEYYLSFSCNAEQALLPESSCRQGIDQRLCQKDEEESSVLSGL